MMGDIITRVPQFDEEGSDLAQRIKDEGFEPGEAPAAGYHNRLFYDTIKSINELDAAAANIDGGEWD